MWLLCCAKSALGTGSRRMPRFASICWRRPTRRWKQLIVCRKLLTKAVPKVMLRAVLGAAKTASKAVGFHSSISLSERTVLKAAKKRSKVAEAANKAAKKPLNG